MKITNTTTIAVEAIGTSSGPNPPKHARDRTGSTISTGTGGDVIGQSTNGLFSAAEIGRAGAPDFGLPLEVLVVKLSFK